MARAANVFFVSIVVLWTTAVSAQPAVPSGQPWPLGSMSARSDDHPVRPRFLGRRKPPAFEDKVQKLEGEAEVFEMKLAEAKAAEPTTNGPMRIAWIAWIGAVVSALFAAFSAWWVKRAEARWRVKGEFEMKLFTLAAESVQRSTVALVDASAALADLIDGREGSEDRAWHAIHDFASTSALLPPELDDVFEETRQELWTLQKQGPKPPGEREEAKKLLRGIQRIYGDRVRSWKERRWNPVTA